MFFCHFTLRAGICVGFCAAVSGRCMGLMGGRNKDLQKMRIFSQEKQINYVSDQN